MRAKVKEVLSNAESKQMVHEAFSGGCFNKCWTLIEKADRSPEDVEDMLLLAQASLWHWKQRNDCTPMNLSRIRSDHLYIDLLKNLSVLFLFPWKQDSPQILHRIE